MRSLYEADINISTAADNSIVADTTGAAIRVWGIWLVASGGANNLKFGNGASSPSYFNAGAMNLAANGSLFFPIQECSAWFTTTKGNGFSINLSAATSVVGRLYYTID